MPTSYPEIYFPIVVQVIIAFAVAAGLIAASTLLGKRARSPLKDTPYESGMAPVGSARERFSVKFYLVGMISSCSISKPFSCIPGRWSSVS